MNFLDDMPKYLLSDYKISKTVVTEGMNINNDFFIELFSGGIRNMLWSTIGGFTFNYAHWHVGRGTVITDAVLGYIKSQNNLKWYNPFTEDNVLEIPGLKLTYGQDPYERECRWSFEFTGKLKHIDPHLSRFNSNDHGWVSWLAYQDIEKVPDHPLLQFIRELCADYCEEMAKILIQTFHSNIFGLTKHDHCKEVTIRQTSMMFWAYIGLRNAFRCNWSDDLVSTSTKLIGNENLVHPVELIANWYNGTDHHEAGTVYTEEFIERVRQGNGEIAKAIIGTFGRSRSSRRKSHAKELSLAATAIGAASVALDILS